MDDDGLTDGAEVELDFLPQDPSDGASVDSDGDTAQSLVDVFVGGTTP